ncbi:DUF732 domain-containing protein [Mycobacteroides salmoniphilum]|uniref:DUF732 domain-containing protein n=1 Tax=Mycobacteroides salmoniphilum TaxID=404941 RepID=UPI0035683591
MITNFRRFWAAGILATSVAAAIGLAGPAHADELQYLQILRDSGPGFTSLDPIDAGLNVHLGNMACETLRNGGTREDAIAAAGLTPLYPRWSRVAIVDAAQQALCPDVKH